MDTCHSDDLVFPVHPFDATIALHDIYCVFLRFDDVLAAAKIRDAIWTVLSIGDWRKLGGRVKTKDTRLEIHVPKVFNEERPPMQFVHESFDHSIEQHDLARHYCIPSDKFHTIQVPEDLWQLASCPQFPRTIRDIVDRDVPQLYFKLMTFKDATLLATNFCHITWDAFGFLGLMKAVQQVLAGKEKDILPVLGAREDILEELALPHLGVKASPEANGDTPEQQPPPESLTSILQAASAPLEKRIVCIPPHVLDRLRDRLREEDPSHSEDDFVRDEEVCTAWFVQQMARAEPKPRNVSMVNLLNARVLVPSIWRAKGIYPQNMFLLTANVLTADVATGPIEPIVTSQREQLASLAGPQQAGKHFASIWNNIDMAIGSLLMDQRRHDPILVNNLSKLTNGLDMDLSDAVIKRGEAVGTGSRVGRPSFFYLDNLSGPLASRSLVVLGNLTGNALMISGCLPTPVWDTIVAYLKEV